MIYWIIDASRLIDVSDIRDAEFETYLKKLTKTDEVPPVVDFAYAPYPEWRMRRIKILLEWGADPRGLEDMPVLKQVYQVGLIACSPHPPSSFNVGKLMQDWERAYIISRTRAIVQAHERRSAQEQGLEVSASPSSITPILEKRSDEERPLVSVNFREKRPFSRELGGLLTKQRKIELKEWREEQDKTATYLMKDIKPELLIELLGLMGQG